jgi:long-subunit fatty acid transport protein
MKYNLLSIIFFLSVTVSCFAGGSEIFPLNGAKTLSLNGLYFAGSDGVVNSVTNPASLIFVENYGIEFSINDRLSENQFNRYNNTLFRSFRNDEYIINGGVYFSITKNIKVGVSYQPSIKYNVEWPYANFFSKDSLSSLLVFDFFNRLTIEAFAPSAAFRFGNFTVGVAPIAYRIKSSLAFPRSNAAWGNFNSAGYQFEYDQEGWAYGFSLGVISQINPELRFALSVRSGYSSNLKGSAVSSMFSDLYSASSKVNLTSKLEIPWIFGVGALYTLSPELTLNLDGQYSLWGSVQKSMNLSFDNAVWQGNLSTVDQLTGITGSSFNLTYKNTIDIGVGLEYIPEGDLSYRFGYKYSQSPNQQETYNMLFPSGDQHWFSAGFGLREENFLLDGTVSYAIGFSKSITNGVVNNINGKYSYNVIIPSVTLKYLIR